MLIGGSRGFLLGKMGDKVVQKKIGSIALNQEITLSRVGQRINK